MDESNTDATGGEADVAPKKSRGLRKLLWYEMATDRMHPLHRASTNYIDYNYILGVCAYVVPIRRSPFNARGGSDEPGATDGRPRPGPRRRRKTRLLGRQELLSTQSRRAKPKMQTAMAVCAPSLSFGPFEVFKQSPLNPFFHFQSNDMFLSCMPRVF
jgi:hypothetical protein